MSAALYFLPHLATLLYPLCLLQRHWAALLQPLIVVVLIHPFLDNVVIGRRVLSAPVSERVGGLALFSWPFLQIGLTVWVGHFLLTHPLSLWGKLSVAVSLGMLAGAFGITVAHELIHRRDRPSLFLGLILLWLTHYSHFRIAHVSWHHKFVGTPLDPSTARRGEGVYRFWWRAVWGNLRVAWRFETDRVKARRGWDRWSSHRFFRFGLGQLVVDAAVFFWGGPELLGLFGLHGLMALLLLESINYIEHYGLSRREIAPLRYEPTADRHSWDSDHLFTNAFLFNLGYHAVHHLDPVRPYELLTPGPQSPRLPFGYSVMLLLALFPPLWFRIMDRRLP